MYIALTLAKSNSYYAAWALSTDAAELPASLQQLLESQQPAQLCAQENIQTHGGNGFTCGNMIAIYFTNVQNCYHSILVHWPGWKEKLIQSLEQANTQS